MFHIDEVTPDLFQVTLSAPEALGHTWGEARNVYVFTGEAPALIDTGYPQTAAHLHAALKTLGIAPGEVQRIVLTALTADAAGAASTFPNARCWTALQPRPDALQRARSRYENAFEALLSLSDTPASWTAERAQYLLDFIFPPPPQDIQYLESGQPIRVGHWILDALDTPGLSFESAAYFSADRGWLFSGPAVNMTPRAIIDDPTAMLQSLGSLGAMSIKRVLPVRGSIDDHPDIFFRTLSLYVTNMRSNMKYVFEEAQSSLDLVQADFGYLPEDLLEIAARLMTYDAVFREFDDAGIVHVVGDGQAEGFPQYKMGAPVAGRTDSLT